MNTHNAALEKYITENYKWFSNDVREKLVEVFNILQREKAEPKFSSSIENVSKQVLLDGIAKRLVPKVRGKRTVAVTCVDFNFKQRVTALHEDYEEIARYLSDNVETFWDAVGEENRISLMALVLAGVDPKIKNYYSVEDATKKLGLIALEAIINDAYATILKHDKYLLNYATC